MIEANSINKIAVKSGLKISKVIQVPLLFTDTIAQTKAVFSVVDKTLNLINPAENSIVFYMDNSGTSSYYEYKVPLKAEGVRIYGLDVYGNSLTGLDNSEILIFVNGYKLEKNEYEIIDNEHLRVLISAPNHNYSNVTIYASPNLSYLGSVQFELPVTTGYKTTILGYSPNSYIFFKNGYLIPFNKIHYEGSSVTFNININLAVDKIQYYSLPSDVLAYYFEAVPGVFSYGPTDYYNTTLPMCYDTVVEFDEIARLVIDDLRPGFFIKEEESVGTGILEILDDTYESNQLHCLKLSAFSKNSYSSSEYFVQVPDARSILHYMSNYDLNNQFLPEILGSFQKLLLNETYDSLLRIKNMRSIESVNSKDITKLLKLLGSKVNLTNTDLTQKHNILDELTKFYKSVGTRKSYNFYNFTTESGNVIKIEQLYTPIKDMTWESEKVKRYQTFKTATDLGAIERTEYRFEYTDYGYVDVFANIDDVAKNTSKQVVRYIGELEDPERGQRLMDDLTHQSRYFPEVIGMDGYQYAIMTDNWEVYLNHEDGTTTCENLPIIPNRYLLDPVPGPNKPTEGYDYGSVEEEAVNFYDYGSVEDKILGHWVTWLEWDRPTEWYPTNHINLFVNIPANVDNALFLEHFRKTFYEIASAVLYIHSNIEIYTIAKDNRWQAGDDIQYGIMAAPVYQTVSCVLANDPARQMSSN